MDCDVERGTLTPLSSDDDLDMIARRAARGERDCAAGRRDIYAVLAEEVGDHLRNPGVVRIVLHNGSSGRFYRKAHGRPNSRLGRLASIAERRIALAVIRSLRSEILPSLIRDMSSRSSTRRER